jgi:SNF2 family DNA or RNA helicase/tetratricopeptide (TPR) repeat protein
MDDLTQRRQQLVKQYHKASTPEREILQLCSVIYESISRTNLLQCVNQSNIKDLSRKNFTSSSLKTVLEKLLKAELLEQKQGLGIACNPLLVEVMTRDALQTKNFERFVKTQEICLPLTTRWSKGPASFRSEDQFIQQVRIGLYRGDMNLVQRRLNEYYQSTWNRDAITLEEIFLLVYNNPFDQALLEKLPTVIKHKILALILRETFLELLPAPDGVLELLREECRAYPPQKINPKSTQTPSNFHQFTLVEQLLWRGEIAEAEDHLHKIMVSEPDIPSATSYLGWIAFLRGENSKAIGYFQDALKAIRKKLNKRKVFFTEFHGVFCILACLKDGSPAKLKEAEDNIKWVVQQNVWLVDIHIVLEELLQIQRGNLVVRDSLLTTRLLPLEAGSGLITFFLILIIYWGCGKDAKKRELHKFLKPIQQQAAESGYRWVAAEAGELLSRILPSAKPDQDAIAFWQTQGLKTIVDTVVVEEPWALSLKALTSLNPGSPTITATTPTASSYRLAWFISAYSNAVLLQPREQKLTAKGGWSQGRNVALKRLKEEASRIEYLTPQDVSVCNQIKVHYGYYGRAEYIFKEQAIAALIGHPLVFWEDAPTTRIEVVSGKPEVQVKQNPKGGITLELLPALRSDRSLQWVKETPTRLKIIEVTPEHRRIAEILGSKNRLDVPDAAKEQVLNAINAIAGIVTVHSDIGGGLENVKEVPADPKPHIHLLPAGEGLKVSIRVRPFTQGGSYFRPGKGGTTIIAEIAGEQLQTTRDLLQEKRLAKQVEVECSILSQYEADEGEWWIEEPEDCLEFLLELHQMGDTVILEWPEGEKLKVQHQADMRQFSMTLRRENDWFAASGELQVSDDLVLDMQRLLTLLEQSPSRFIPLGDGQFLALTQEFRKRLDEFRAFSDKHGKGARFHPLAAVALTDFTDEVGQLKVDKHWQEHVKRLKSMDAFQPKLPSTLQAELRDYQIDGFRWLARLAHWGVGACLADDMGLGKTLQALALILTRAAEGATLILAPTSVCLNWMAEVERFAPTLNLIQFGSGDRQAVLDELQPLDMVICSYGLLQQEDVAEMLAKVQWQTIVLDEAQAIKNMATKRSQAAMKLESGFKLITTGTPIENHLGELWNLFRFINPGLLGSLEKFNQRFAGPIERQQDRQAREQLKKLIQPFILRRTKNQVLQELPPRTEILLHVELSQAEMAFYEALRQEAIAKLTASDATAGQKHLQVLAEIMKLRRACCNVQLVNPELSLSSAKLAVFGEVLTELLENNHKALVFSQFVDHLSYIRTYLDEQNITYQYLDGSTPAKERKVRIDAFQRGKGDVFLISLKAGGTGLNLTAADYVIHMDPWWNPAVEDQASDRAHRIGQQRPVTIYRLVTKQTIEEKIVNLHQHKRDLADSLLEGTDVSGKISTDDLLRLMQE